MNLSDFDFELPEELIAIRPVSPRSAARLLVAKGNNVDDSCVSDLPVFLKSGDRLVFNDTKVLPARLDGFRSRFIDVDNVASAKIFEKCNFRITKTLTKPIPNSKKKRVIVYVCKNNIQVSNIDIRNFYNMWAKNFNEDFFKKICLNKKLKFM